MTATTAQTATTPAGASPSVAYTLPPGLFGRLSASILDLLLGLPPGIFTLSLLVNAEASPEKHWQVYLIYLLVYLAGLGLAALQVGSPGKWLLRQRLITTRPGSSRLLSALLRTLPLLVVLVALTGLGLAGLDGPQLGIGARWIGAVTLLFLGTSLAVTVFNDEHRSIPDLLAGTRVIRQARPAVNPRWELAAPLLPAPRSTSISLWVSAVFLALAVLLTLISTIGQQYPDTLTLVTTWLMVSAIMLPPLAGLVGAVLQQSWAKPYNAILFLILAAWSGSATVFSYGGEDPLEPEQLLFLVITYVIATGLGVCLLRAIPAPGIVLPAGQGPFPEDLDLQELTETPPLPDGPAGGLQSLGDVMRLLAGIAARYPGARSEFFPCNPHTGVSLAFPVQPGIPQPLFINCTGNDVIKVSLGEAVFTFSRLRQDYPADWCIRTVTGLLEGRVQVDEFRKDDEIIRADLKDLQNGQILQRWYRFRFVPPWGIVRSTVRCQAQISRP